MMNKKQLTYSIQKDVISVYYKDIVNDPLTEGQTAKDLINLVKQEDLPDIDEIRYLKTTVSRVKSKYRVISLLKYNANGEPESQIITIEDEIKEYDQPTKTLIFEDVTIDEEDGTLVLNIV